MSIDWSKRKLAAPKASDSVMLMERFKFVSGGEQSIYEIPYPEGKLCSKCVYLEPVFTVLWNDTGAEGGVGHVHFCKDCLGDETRRLALRMTEMAKKA